MNIFEDAIDRNSVRRLAEDLVDAERTTGKTGIDPTAFIHPRAFVEGAIVGARTRIWQFASVIRGTVLGADCNVASCATLDGPVFGDRCIICQGVAMGPGFVFGSDCFVGPNVTICNDAWPRADKTGFDAELLRNGYVTVQVGDGAAIGANAVVLPGIVIGRGAVVAAGAVVNRNVPDETLFTRSGSLRPAQISEQGARMREALAC